MKLIVADLDGCLLDARELHYEALNTALRNVDKKYVINREEHLSTYDGLPTSKKLSMLTEKKGLPKEFYQQIWEDKQRATINLIKKEKEDERIKKVLDRLKKDGYILAVASNSIRETVKMALLKKGFMEYIDFFYSNQDVKNPKPNPEMFLRCMIDANVAPSETLIVEDSHIGRKAALSSGAKLCAVRDPDDFTYERIMESIEDRIIKPKWQGGEMNILIPMAGAGTRFQQAGYTFPKPLIDVRNKPMIQMVVENLNMTGRYIFVVQKEHYEKFNLKYLLNLVAPNCEIIQTEGLTEGATCTTLLAKHLIDNDKPLVMANSDQFLEWDSNQFMYAMIADKIDAGLATFEGLSPKWSYAKLGEDGFVSEVAEKKPISNIASTGIYYYKKGSDYVKYAEQMIKKNIRINGEFYVCPVFNEMIADGKKIKALSIERMWGTGTPEDLTYFVQNYQGDF
jgi:HAD superfamily hydrolase (TIGR01509 family)